MLRSNSATRPEPPQEDEVTIHQSSTAEADTGTAHKCRYVRGLANIRDTSWTLPATLNTEAETRLGIFGPRHLLDARRKAGPFPISGHTILVVLQSVP
jgi:hypothetical protein